MDAIEVEDSDEETISISSAHTISVLSDGETSSRSSSSSSSENNDYISLSSVDSIIIHERGDCTIISKDPKLTIKPVVPLIYLEHMPYFSKIKNGIISIQDINKSTFTPIVVQFEKLERSTNFQKAPGFTVEIESDSDSDFNCKPLKRRSESPINHLIQDLKMKCTPLSVVVERMPTSVLSRYCGPGAGLPGRPAKRVRLPRRGPRRRPTAHVAPQHQHQLQSPPPLPPPPPPPPLRTNSKEQPPSKKKFKFFHVTGNEHRSATADTSTQKAQAPAQSADNMDDDGTPTIDISSHRQRPRGTFSDFCKTYDTFLENYYKHKDTKYFITVNDDDEDSSKVDYNTNKTRGNANTINTAASASAAPQTSNMSDLGTIGKGDNFIDVSAANSNQVWPSPSNSNFATLKEPRDLPSILQTLLVSGQNDATKFCQTVPVTVPPNTQPNPQSSMNEQPQIPNTALYPPLYYVTPVNLIGVNGVGSNLSVLNQSNQSIPSSLLNASILVVPPVNNVVTAPSVPVLTVGYENNSLISIPRVCVQMPTMPMITNVVSLSAPNGNTGEAIKNTLQPDRCTVDPSNRVMEPNRSNGSVLIGNTGRLNTSACAIPPARQPQFSGEYRSRRAGRLLHDLRRRRIHSLVLLMVDLRRPVYSVAKEWVMLSGRPGEPKNVAFFAHSPGRRFCRVLWEAEAAQGTTDDDEDGQPLPCCKYVAIESMPGLAIKVLPDGLNQLYETLPEHYSDSDSDTGDPVERPGGLNDPPSGTRNSDVLNIESDTLSGSSAQETQSQQCRIKVKSFAKITARSNAYGRPVGDPALDMIVSQGQLYKRMNSKNAIYARVLTVVPAGCAPQEPLFAWAPAARTIRHVSQVTEDRTSTLKPRRNRTQWTPEQMESAIRAVQSGGLSKKAAAALHKIPGGTLTHRLNSASNERKNIFVIN